MRVRWQPVPASWPVSMLDPRRSLSALHTTLGQAATTCKKKMLNMVLSFNTYTYVHMCVRLCVCACELSEKKVAYTNLLMTYNFEILHLWCTRMMAEQLILWVVWWLWVREGLEMVVVIYIYLKEKVVN